MGLLVLTSDFAKTCYFNEATGFRGFIFCQVAKGSCGQRVNGNARPRQMPFSNKSSTLNSLKISELGKESQVILSLSVNIMLLVTHHPPTPTRHGRAPFETTWK